MRNYTLSIAGYRIKVESHDDGPELAPSERFLKNMVSNNGYDVLIRVHHGMISLPEDAERVLVAPYSIEVKGIKIHRSENFWSVYKNLSDLYIITSFPWSDKRAYLKFSLTVREWDLWILNGGHATDPLDYPLDGLILYYLTAISCDIMIHASGVYYGGQGYIFCGSSGKGKSTMASLWDNLGAKIIHDDRIIIRSTDGVYRMYNTPVYREDYPKECDLTKIFIIEHGEENRITPLKGASAVSGVISNCIQHNYNPEMIARFLGSVSIMCSIIPVATLSFMPNRKVIDYILQNEQ